MEEVSTIDNFLWFIVGFLASGMGAVLIFGWLKGQHWNRDAELKRREK